MNAAFGGRWQWTPTLVLDAGVSRRLRSAIGPDFALTIGLSHAFAIRASESRRVWVKVEELY